MPYDGIKLRGCLDRTIGKAAGIAEFSTPQWTLAGNSRTWGVDPSLLRARSGRFSGEQNDHTHYSGNIDCDVGAWGSKIGRASTRSCSRRPSRMIVK
jgi:hypothetical protein